jgi:chromosome segregation ATPase
LNLPTFKKLHEGLYYTDVSINKEGSYIVHAVAFYKGFLSHDSRVVVASLTTINTIQDSVDQLRVALNSTNNQVNGLGNKINDARRAVNSSQDAITNSVEQAQSSIQEDVNSAKKAVDDLQQASGQVNSIFLPILALISIIIALQISLFARIRASYR